MYSREALGPLVLIAARPRIEPSRAVVIRRFLQQGSSHFFEFILEFKWCYYLWAQSLECAHRDKVAYVYL